MLPVVPRNAVKICRCNSGDSIEYGMAKTRIETEQDEQGKTQGWSSMCR